MKLSNFQLHNKQLPSIKEYRGYKIPLSTLFCLSEELYYTPENIHKVTHHFEPAITPDFFEEVYALVPIKTAFHKKTFVLYKNYALYVELTPLDIIQNILKAYQYLDFKVYARTIHSIFNKKTTIIPIATQKFSIFSLGSIHEKETIWINPARVCNIEETNHLTFIELDNSFTIGSDRQARGIKRRMIKSFIIHGILKREADADPIRPTTNLLEYLDIPSNIVTRTILKGVEYQHLPGLQGDFFERYNFEAAFLAKRKLLQRLDIEE